MKSFLQFTKDINIFENLVVKKIKTPEGKWRFVVDSDLTDPRLASKETYTNKNKIKSLGFYWDKNINKWVSNDEYDQNQLSSAIPMIKRKIFSLNKDSEERTIEDISDDIEEYLELGIADKLKNFFQELKEKIIQKQNSPEVREFLNFRSKFTNRSFNNQILIWIQAKSRGINPTHLEGKRTWEQKFGRKLKTGAKAIKIYVPVFIKSKKEDEEIPDKDKQQDETRNPSGFTLGNVYDISDTEPIKGKEHMYVQTPKWFDETTPDETTRYIYDALLEFAKENNIEISISDSGLGGARGVSKKGSVQLLQDNISTMIHELTHEILHTIEKRKGLDKEVLELQAEGVTYLVLKHYGLPSEHAEIYLALWNKDPENIKQNEEIIRQTAKMFIEYIDKKTMESDEKISESQGFRNWLKNN